jgi:hypothetical protein
MMILGTIVIIYLEIKRYRVLRYQTDTFDENGFKGYKIKALRYLGVEAIILLSLSIWMIV